MKTTFGCTKLCEMAALQRRSRKKDYLAEKCSEKNPFSHEQYALSWLKIS